MKLAFMHIPKTGGIATERVILAACGADLSVCPVYQPPEYDGKTYADYPDHAFYQGHFRMDFLDTLPKDYLKVTVLRPPQDLVLSLYNHIASRPAHALHEAANAEGASFAGLISGNAGLQNIQTKYVLGRVAYRDICLDETRKPAERVEAMLEVARENLKKFDLIGCTPRLGDFIADLGPLTGKDLPAPKRENQNKFSAQTADALTEEDQAAIRRATWADRPLYKMVWKEFLEPRYGKEARAARKGAENPA